MIALADGIPLIQLDNGELVAFQQEWLVRALVEAAAKAGYQKWWLAEHVAGGMVTYLALHCEDNVVSVPKLAEAVQSVLQVIGYAEIAPYFAPGLPGGKLSLAELAREAGSGYELVFFKQLGIKLQKIMSGGVRFVELVGLHSCVKQLKEKKYWSRGCDALQAEIVSFVRTQTSLKVELGEEITVRLS
jgi:hypothetical protein